MAGRRKSVAEVARSVGVDPEDALITMWLEGLSYLESIDSRIRPQDVALAYSALGTATPKGRTQISYWERSLSMTSAEFRALLAKNGVVVSVEARTLPKGSLKKVERICSEIERPRFAASRSHKSEVVSSAIPWRIVGPPHAGIRYLTFEDVLKIHEALVVEARLTADPIDPPGPRSESLVHSALYRPQTAYSDTRKYPSVVMAGAAVFHSLTLNHAFHNGNKRTALMSLVAFLDINNFILTCSEDDLFQTALKTAKRALVTGRHANADEEVIVLAEWLSGNSRKLNHAEKPMRWHRLKARLRDYDCTFTSAAVGNRINIQRDCLQQKSGFFGRKRMVNVPISTQVAWRGDTSEADPTTIKRIRRELRLDDANGVDSEMFYSGHDFDQAIAQYRQTLRKLSKI